MYSNEGLVQGVSHWLDFSFFGHRVSPGLTWNYNDLVPSRMLHRRFLEIHSPHHLLNPHLYLVLFPKSWPKCFGASANLTVMGGIFIILVGMVVVVLFIGACLGLCWDATWCKKCRETGNARGADPGQTGGTIERV